MLCSNSKERETIMDLMNKKSGRVCCKSAATLLVLCVVLSGCSGSSDQTDATVLPGQQATTTAGIADASDGNAVASSGETEVVDSARTSPSSAPTASAADNIDKAGLPNSAATTVIPSTTTVVSSSKVNDERLRAWEALSGFISKALSGNANAEEFNEIMERFTYKDDSKEEAAIQQPAELEETTTEETDEETETLKECQTPEIDAAETAENTDFIKGRISLSDDGKPLRLESLRVDTYPGLWVPVGPTDNLEILNLELRDNLGTTVYCTPFSIHPEFYSNFLVRIPDPPDYDRIAVVNSDIDVGEVRRSRNTPIVEDLVPEDGSLYCYEDVIRGRTDIRVRGKIRDSDFFDRTGNFTYSVWISTDGRENYKNIVWPSSTTGRNFEDGIHPAELYRVEDVYIRVHVSDSTRTSYAETYVKFDPSSCSAGQEQVETERKTSPERQNQEISAEVECDLPKLNPKGEYNNNRLDHSINASVFLSLEDEPLGLWSFGVKLLPTPRILSDPSSEYENFPIVAIELRDASGEAVFRSQYRVFWPQLGRFTESVLPNDIFFWAYYRRGYFASDAYIPDSSEYESIAILYAGEEIGVFHKSSNSPVVEIVSPNCGEIYQSDDTIRMTWYGYDLDGDDLDFDVWYSIDEGASYRRTSLGDDYTFGSNPSFVSFREDFSGRVYVRVHATDGFLTDYDETYFEISEGETSDDAVLEQEGL